MLFHALQNSGAVAILSLAVVLVPLVMGISFAWRPTEARLALMRPLSLASLFAALTGFCAGVIDALLRAGGSHDYFADRAFVVALIEAMVPLFVAFGCLTVAWLCVAVGLRRQPA
jgi:hypothetical protein